MGYSDFNKFKTRDDTTYVIADKRDVGHLQSLGYDKVKATGVAPAKIGDNYLMGKPTAKVKADMNAREKAQDQLTEQIDNPLRAKKDFHSNTRISE